MDTEAARDLLHELGVRDLPAKADESVLEAALFFAERLKRLRFLTEEAPDGTRFRVEDDRVRVLALVEPVEDVGDGLEDVIEQAALQADRSGERLACLVIDGRRAGLREYELQHALWGRVTLYDYPHKPLMPSHPLVHEARDRGWGSVLKDHNLLPGRGIVVEDGDHGFLLTRDAAKRFCAYLLIPHGTPPTLDYNPFCPAIADDPEFRFWLQWGSGSSEASQWVTMLDEHERERS